MAGIKHDLVVRGTILGDRTPSDVLLRAGQVVAVRRVGKRAAGAADVGSPDTVLAPPLFDIQVNGYGGVDLQGEGCQPSDVRAITDLLAAKGVAHWVPTIITGASDEMEHACRMVAQAMRDPVVARAVPGIHLEGPYISPVDGPRGAHAKQHVRVPDRAEFDRWLRAANGQIAYVTLAPEVKGAIPFIRALAKRGILVSIGHHAATREDIAKAVEAGARLSTHLGNGMAAQINRHINPLWPQLAEDRLAASLIADLEHLPEPVLKSCVRAKTPARVVLTSDVVHLAGLKPGAYSLGSVDVELLPTGRICLKGTELLAGSSLWLLQGVVNAVQVTDLTLQEAIASATTIPAKLIGAPYRFTPPRVGRPADLLAFDIDRGKSRWRAAIQGVWIHGERKA